jgi:hypothetical protein
MDWLNIKDQTTLGEVAVFLVGAVELLVQG